MDLFNSRIGRYCIKINCNAKILMHQRTTSFKNYTFKNITLLLKMFIQNKFYGDKYFINEYNFRKKNV